MIVVSQCCCVLEHLDQVLYLNGIWLDYKL